MWFIWPYTMRTRDPNSNSEQTVPMQVRRPTVVMEADPHTETRSYSRCGSNNNGSTLSSPSQRSSGSVRPMIFSKFNHIYIMTDPKGWRNMNIFILVILAHAYLQSYISTFSVNRQKQRIDETTTQAWQFAWEIKTRPFKSNLKNTNISWWHPCL